MYANGKIYKLVNEELGLTYYGSTTQTLEKRLMQHEYVYNNSKKYTSRQLFEKGKVEIILVEEISCNNRNELLQRERFYIENNDCVNKLIPLRTIQEWSKQYREKNKEKIDEKGKIYREKNKEKINEIRREKFTCECGCIVSRRNLLRHKKTKKHQTFLNTCNA